MSGTDTASTQRTSLLLAAILLVAAGLRFGFLSSRGWWFDEALTVVETRLALPEMLRQLSLNEHTPPLYFILANGWTTIAGTSEAGLRSFSATLGVGAVWLAYLVAARSVSTRAGLVAAALAAVNPMLVWFSLEARAYSLLTLLGGWSFLSFVAARERPRGRAIVAWTITSALALWTHYFAVFLVGPEALWLLLRHPRSRAVQASLLALALAAAALLPVLASKLGGVDWIGRHSWLMRVASVPPEILLGFQPPAPLLLAPLALLTPVVALWLLCDPCRSRRTARRDLCGARRRVGARRPDADHAPPAPRRDAVALPRCGDDSHPRRDRGRSRHAPRGRTRRDHRRVHLRPRHRDRSRHGIRLEVRTRRLAWCRPGMGPADDVRALVVTPSRGALPLGLYRSGLGEWAGPSAAVSEIVTIALPPMFRKLGQPSMPPRAPSPPLEAPFEMVERVDADSFTLVRYRAAKAVSVDRARLAALRLGPEDAAVLLESPGAISNLREK